MRYGIIADIHGNIEALESILGLLGKEGVDAYLCCGDIVGYGPSPNECIERLLSLPRLFAIAGNHDAASASGSSLSSFNPFAAMAIEWTRGQLKEENLKFLRGLREIYRSGTSFCAVHGSPREPLNEYVFDNSIFRLNLGSMEKDLYFIGHTHAPVYFWSVSERKSGSGYFVSGKEFLLEKGTRYVINVGSVGQPRDGDVRAACCLFDEDDSSLILFRQAYDINCTQEKMRRAGLPDFLVERLSYGK